MQRLNWLKSVMQWRVLCAALVLVAFPVPHAIAADSYTLAVVPQYSPLTVHRNWQPIIEALADETGIKLQLRVYNSFNRFLSGLERGDADFVYMSPYHLVLARKTQPYAPLLRDDSRDLVGLIVVRKDSSYKTIQDLDGKQIDFPSLSAFAASLYLRAYLREKLHIEYIPRYVGNHDNVYRHVALGLAEGGGGVNNTLQQQPINLQQRLRVIYRVPGVASHPLAVHQRVPEKVRTVIQKTLLSWQYDPAHLELLKAIQFEMPVVANYDEDYKSLENIGLEKYMVEPGR